LTLHLIRMKKILLVIAVTLTCSDFFGGSSKCFAQLSPAITHWVMNDGTNGFAGISTNVQLVQYSTNNVYVNCSDIASWIPVGYDWPNNPWFPQDMGFTFKITLNPQQNTGQLVAPWFGHIGVWMNGVSIYNPMDAKTYLDSGVWYQNAVYFEHLETETMDSCLGHPNGLHEYHLHVHPKCLWNETDNTVHSPLLGYAFDGFPIYGSYTYANTNGTGPITRMTSSYRLRNITDRTTLPDGTILQPQYYGPSLATYPLGAYIQDYEYAPGLGTLDSLNGRFCITPEYPSGTYAYFVTLDNSFNPTYPYVLGPKYYGTVQPGNTGPNSGFNTVSESTTVYNSVNDGWQFEVGRLLIYPNPVADELHFKLSSSENYLTGSIYNSFGEIIKTGIVYSGIDYRFDVSTLPSGIYFFKVFSSSKSSTNSFVISK